MSTNNYIQLEAKFIQNQDIINTGKDILNKLNTQYKLPSVILAGGALRDSVYGVKPKDYDFFISDPNKTLNLSYLIDEVIPELFDTEKQDEAREVGLEYKYKVFSYIIDGKKCQFMYSHEFVGDMMNDFDYSFNAIYLHDNSVYVSKQFMSTLKTKLVKPLSRFTWEPDAYGTLARFKYLKEKFPQLNFQAVEDHYAKVMGYPIDAFEVKPVAKPKKASGLRARVGVRLFADPFPQAARQGEAPRLEDWNVNAPIPDILR